MSFAKPSAPDKPDTTAGLMCSANDCPMRWSVDAGSGRLCSYHAWVDPKTWPRVTDDLRRAGPWRLVSRGSPAVEDMKTRIRGRLQSPMPSL